jgi:hypothetical protein
MLALAIISAIVLLLGPLALALTVFLLRQRLRRAVELRGFAELETGDVNDHLQGPAYGRRGGHQRRSLDSLIEEVRAPFGKPY